MLESGSGGGILWRVGEDRQTLTKVTSSRFLHHERAPLLFIHGIEFSEPEEAMRDLVNPMLQVLGNSRIMDRAIYVFSWNSLLTNRVKITDVLNWSPLKRIQFAIRELPKCHRYLGDVERRAKDAAKALIPFALESNSENRVGPTVITHSMGSLVWAETLKLLLETSASITKPGIWWSLQPAMARNSFSVGGDYHAIPSIYTGRESAKAMIWYSRMDYILSSAYILSKRGLALGHWGCANSSLPQRDITKWALEAHGMQHLSANLGHFFERVSSILPEEADALGF